MTPSQDSLPGLNTIIRGVVIGAVLLTWLYVTGLSGLLTFIVIFAVLYGTVILADRTGIDRWYVGALFAVASAATGTYVLLTGAVAPELGVGALLLAAIMTVLLVVDRNVSDKIETPDDRFTMLFEFQIQLGVINALRESPHSISELTKDLDLTHSRIERALDRLQRLGFVTERNENTYELDRLPFGN